MPSIPIPDQFVAVTAADAQGNITLTDALAATLFPGSVGWLTLDDASATLRVRLRSIGAAGSGGTGLTLVSVGPGPAEWTAIPQAPNYGVLDVSSCNGSAHLCIEAQACPIDPAYLRRVAVP
jgi:hypothetical protein